jgi:hypothetical protein
MAKVGLNDAANWRGLLLLAVVLVVLGVYVYRRPLLRLTNRPHVVWAHHGLGWGPNRIVVGPDHTIYVRTSSRDGGSQSLFEAIASDGQVKWTNDSYFLPAVATDSTLYLTIWKPGTPSSLKALRSEGQEIWSFAIGSSDWMAGIALGPGGKIYTGGTRLRNFLRDGTLAWEVGDPADHLQYSRPVVSENGSVYAVTQSGAYREPGYKATLDAFDSAGSEQWNLDVHYHEARIFPLAEGRALAVGINIAKPMVTQDPGYGISSTGVPAEIPPSAVKTNVLAAGMLYSVSERIAILDPSGKARCETSPFNSYSAPVVAKNGNVYIGGETEVLAFGGNCSERWRLEVGTQIKSVAIGDDGAV